MRMDINDDAFGGMMLGMVYGIVVGFVVGAIFV